MIAELQHFMTTYIREKTDNLADNQCTLCGSTHATASVYHFPADKTQEERAGLHLGADAVKHTLHCVAFLHNDGTFMALQDSHHSKPALRALHPIYHPVYHSVGISTTTCVPLFLSILPQFLCAGTSYVECLFIFSHTVFPRIVAIYPHLE